MSARCKYETMGFRCILDTHDAAVPHNTTVETAQPGMVVVENGEMRIYTGTGWVPFSDILRRLDSLERDSLEHYREGRDLNERLEQVERLAGERFDRICALEGQMQIVALGPYIFECDNRHTTVRGGPGVHDLPFIVCPTCGMSAKQA